MSSQFSPTRVEETVGGAALHPNLLVRLRGCETCVGRTVRGDWQRPSHPRSSLRPTAGSRSVAAGVPGRVRAGPASPPGDRHVPRIARGCGAGGAGASCFRQGPGPFPISGLFGPKSGGLQGREPTAGLPSSLCAAPLEGLSLGDRVAGTRAGGGGAGECARVGPPRPEELGGGGSPR